MITLIAELLELAAGLGDIIFRLWDGIWDADAQVRERSRFGESGLDRQSRRFMARLCGGIFLLLALGTLALWWFAGAR